MVLFACPELASRTLAISRPIRVWNGIFAAGDWHAKRGLKAMRPEIGDHHTREMAAKTAFLLASYQLRAHQGSNLGPAD